MNYEIIRLMDKPELKEQAAQWFHEKWGFRWKHIRKAWMIV